MELDAYQKKARETDQVPYRSDHTDAEISELLEKIVPLLGLAGETGELLSEYKKYLRDGSAHKLFKEQIKEELGDLLWYVSNVASKFDLTLNEIAQGNLDKTKDRWGRPSCSIENFDGDFPENQSFPRRFEVELREEKHGAEVRVQPYINSEQIGAGLTDNFREDDGYRFHDVFHFSYVDPLPES